MMAIKAYRRRRGWLAWQTAVLQRFDFGKDYPALHEIMGEREPEYKPQTGEAADWVMGQWAGIQACLGGEAEKEQVGG